MTDTIRPEDARPGDLLIDADGRVVAFLRPWVDGYPWSQPDRVGFAEHATIASRIDHEGARIVRAAEVERLLRDEAIRAEHDLDASEARLRALEEANEDSESRLADVRRYASAAPEPAPEPAVASLRFIAALVDAAVDSLGGDDERPDTVTYMHKVRQAFAPIVAAMRAGVR